MRVIKILGAGLALMAGILTISVPAWADNCRLTRLASVDMETDPRPVIEVTIAGKPYHFLVDTGAVFSEIAGDVATSLGLSPKVLNGVELYGAGGEELKHYVVVEDFSIGHLRADKLNMVVMDRKGDSSIDGILGPDVMMQYDVDFDFGAHKFNVFSQDHCPGNVVYWATDYAEVGLDKGSGHIAFQVTLDGHNISAVFDTGSTATLLAEHVARQGYGLTVQSPGMKRTTTRLDM